MQSSKKQPPAVRITQSGTQPLPPEGLVRLRPLLGVVAMSRSSWLLLIKKGEAPKPLKIGASKILTAWRVEDIRAWLAAQGGEK